jgi:endonuclease/exonuclease/phosphatase family metal-dependent hydrolase
MKSCELDVLAYNVWLRPGVFDGQWPRARHLADALTGHDVLVLSEVFRRSVTEFLLTKLAEHYPYQTRIVGDDPAHGPLQINGGVIIVSRYPIVSEDHQTFGDLSRGPDAWSAKGVAYACIDKLGQRYHVFGSHTQSDPEPLYRAAYSFVGRDAQIQYRRLRAAQFDRIKKMIESKRIPDCEPVIVAGDLNTDRLGCPDEFAEMLDRIDVSFPRVAEDATSTFTPTQNPLCGEGRDQWLDYVLWSRSHLAPERCLLEVVQPKAKDGWQRHPWGQRYEDLSDHYAVRCRMTFP